MDDPTLQYNQISAQIELLRTTLTQPLLARLHEKLELLDEYRLTITDPGLRDQLDRGSTRAHSLLDKAIEDLRHPTHLSPRPNRPERGGDWQGFERGR